MTARNGFHRADQAFICLHCAAMMTALLILIAGALLLVPLESWMHTHLHGLWRVLADHVYLPGLRCLVLVFFLNAVFPAPLLDERIVRYADDIILRPPHVSALLNWLFLLGALLPVLPVMQKLTALILPLQTLAGAWLLVGSFEQQTGLQLHGAWQDLAGVLGLSLVAHLLLIQVAGVVQRGSHWDSLTVYDGLSLALLPPLVLLFTRNLVL